MPEYNITPVPAPRMTKRDKRLPHRPCVQRYFDFRDAVKKAGITIPSNGSAVIFYLPMASSWSKKDKAKFNMTPHQQTPDVDNLAKALLDSVFKNDSHIWDIRISKRWAYEGKIVIIEE